jgi:rSAM/selenodomain-associated transferase 1
VDGRRATGPLEALAVLAKEPAPGRVKTRLCPPLSPADAARLGSSLLADTAEEMARLGRVRRILFLAPPDAVGRIAGGPFAGFERLPQRGRGLGERMRNAAATCFAGGARRVVLVGWDCPELTAVRVRQAFRELRAGAGTVFGPSVDGGYYLVGLSSPDARLFRRIPWSTGAVLRESSGRCRAAGTPFSLLLPERDVDTYGDLLSLRERFASRPTPRCPRTREFLTAFFAARGASPSAPRG